MMLKIRYNRILPPLIKIKGKKLFLIRKKIQLEVIAIMFMEKIPKYNKGK